MCVYVFVGGGVECVKLVYGGGDQREDGFGGGDGGCYGWAWMSGWVREWINSLSLNPSLGQWTAVYNTYACMLGIDT